MSQLPANLLAPGLANNLSILRWAAGQSDRISATSQAAKELNIRISAVCRAYRYFVSYKLMTLEFVNTGAPGIYKRFYKVTALGVEVAHAFA